MPYFFTFQDKSPLAQQSPSHAPTIVLDSSVCDKTMRMGMGGEDYVITNNNYGDDSLIKPPSRKTSMSPNQIGRISLGSSPTPSDSNRSSSSQAGSGRSPRYSMVSSGAGDTSSRPSKMSVTFASPSSSAAL